MDRQFIFNGRSSREFGLFPSGNDTYNAPKKIYNMESIPGRNGGLLITEGYYENLDVTYHVYLTSGLRTKTDAIRDWLYSAEGYCRLEDNWHPEEFRLAFFSGPMEWETLLNKFGQCDITFSCKPQRFLKEGEKEITFGVTDHHKGSGNVNACVINPTAYKARPQIMVSGGIPLIVNYSICDSNGNGYGPYQACYKGYDDETEYMTLDSERLIAYDDDGLCTGRIKTPKEAGWPDAQLQDPVTYTGTPFLVLLPGKNYIRLVNYSSEQYDQLRKAIIIPNYYRI